MNANRIGRKITFVHILFGLFSALFILFAQNGIFSSNDWLSKMVDSFFRVEIQTFSAVFTCLILGVYGGGRLGDYILLQDKNCFLYSFFVALFIVIFSTISGVIADQILQLTVWSWDVEAQCRFVPQVLDTLSLVLILGLIPIIILSFSLGYCIQRYK